MLLTADIKPEHCKCLTQTVTVYYSLCDTLSDMYYTGITPCPLVNIIPLVYYLYCIYVSDNLICFGVGFNYNFPFSAEQYFRTYRRLQSMRIVNCHLNK